MKLKAFLILSLIVFFPQQSKAICPFDLSCLSNPYGAGSPYKRDGIMNPYSQYGSPYSNNSWTNPYRQDSISNPYGKYGSPYSPNSLKNPYGAGNPFINNKIFVVPGR